MSRQARRVVEVSLDAQHKAPSKSVQDSPQNKGYLDAGAIAQRYGVELSDDESQASQASQASQGDGEMVMQGKQQAVDVFPADLAQRTQQLIIKLDEKNSEIERLCTLLEAVQPVEGLDPSKLYDILDGQNDMPDYKDAKIVDLAKRLRRMTVQLNKERAKNVQAAQRIADLEAGQAAALVSTTSPSNTQHSQQGSTNSAVEVDAEALNDQKREIAMLHKQVEELRRRHERSQEELKRTQRLLQKEVGEGADLSKVSEEGWRGRAQQIIMLKTKLKRMEAAAQDGDSVMTGKTRTSMTSMTTASRRVDVDLRAEADLHAMEREKQRMMEQLSAEHQQLHQELEQSTKRCDAARARVKVLENGQVRAKGQLKVLIQKADTDDSLIQALKDELASLREQSNVKSAARRSGEQPHIPPVDDNARELARLRRLINQQNEQIAHQESVILRLRTATDLKIREDVASVDS